MFKKILIANRGEIAVRIHRACRELGIATVAVHSEADANAIHVKLADEAVCIGPAPSAKSYLSIPAILAAAEVTGADAIHPGYGFLSENARFAEVCEKTGVTFIGPKAEHILRMGDKINAIELMNEIGIPTIPGSGGGLTDMDEAREIAGKIGYPVLLKAAAGGGGRGMQIVRKAEDLAGQFATAQAEALAAYGDGRVYLEKFLDAAKHIEIQVLCDSHGNVLTLGERDCSLQRRHQKVLEETPCAILTDAQRDEAQALARKVCKHIGYLGAGTLEFLFQDGHFYFIEMNTRLQVEHPVTEMVTGQDLVREQIRVAAGLPLSLAGREQMTARGHSIEVRINAEDPLTFIPSPGKITEYFPAGGPGVRVDSGIYSEYVVPSHYDSMLGKLIVHGADRAEAIARLRRAVEEFIIGGIKTNLPLHARIIETEAFQSGDYTIHTLGNLIKQWQAEAELEASAATTSTDTAEAA